MTKETQAVVSSAGVFIGAIVWAWTVHEPRAFAAVAATAIPFGFAIYNKRVEDRKKIAEQDTTPGPLPASMRSRRMVRAQRVVAVVAIAIVAYLGVSQYLSHRAKVQRQAEPPAIADGQDATPEQKFTTDVTSETAKPPEQAPIVSNLPKSPERDAMVSELTAALINVDQHLSHFSHKLTVGTDKVVDVSFTNLTFKLVEVKRVANQFIASFTLSGGMNCKPPIGTENPLHVRCELYVVLSQKDFLTFYLPQMRSFELPVKTSLTEAKAIEEFLSKVSGEAIKETLAEALKK